MEPNPRTEPTRTNAVLTMGRPETCR
jgi:hypothetical protein